jgi:hypothetical protein
MNNSQLFVETIKRPLTQTLYLALASDLELDLFLDLALDLRRALTFVTTF